MVDKEEERESEGEINREGGERGVEISKSTIAKLLMVLIFHEKKPCKITSVQSQKHEGNCRHQNVRFVARQWLCKINASNDNVLM